MSLQRQVYQWSTPPTPPQAGKSDATSSASPTLFAAGSVAKKQGMVHENQPLLSTSHQEVDPDMSPSRTSPGLGVAEIQSQV
jgi:hypothetical protein